MARAIAYVCAALDRNRQIETIKEFAGLQGLEIVAWCEDAGDAVRLPDLLERPGIRALLGCPLAFDLVLCDRVRTLSRSIARLEPFLDELRKKGVGFECAVYEWDLVSQQCRRRCRSLPVRPAFPASTRRFRVAKPAQFHFAHLVHPAP